MVLLYLWYKVLWPKSLCPMKVLLFTAATLRPREQGFHHLYKQSGSSLEQPMMNHFLSHLPLAVKPLVIIHCVENSTSQGYFSITCQNVPYCRCWKNDSNFSSFIIHGDWGHDKQHSEHCNLSQLKCVCSFKCHNWCMSFHPVLCTSVFSVFLGIV